MTNRFDSKLLNFTLTDFSLQQQTGVQDYEIFNDQLDSLGCWIVEAEEALRVQDPNSSTDLTVVQDRMEELKVCICCFLLWGELSINFTDCM